MRIYYDNDHEACPYEIRCQSKHIQTIDKNSKYYKNNDHVIVAYLVCLECKFANKDRSLFGTYVECNYKKYHTNCGISMRCI